MIERLCPHVKVAVGHGQMEGKKLEAVILDFMDGMYDVLVATTIVESGIDIPNANTLIIYNADLFGLSQLYQLRGRVGRSDVRAYAYLTTKKGKVLNDNAIERLKVLKTLILTVLNFQVILLELLGLCVKIQIFLLNDGFLNNMIQWLVQ